MAYQLLSPFTLAGVILFTGLTYFVARGALPALMNAPGGPRRNWQFRLSDMYILIFQLCISGWLTYEPDEEFGTLFNIAGLAILWSLQGLWWYWGVRFLSRNNVTDSLRRLIILGVVFPLFACFPLLNCVCIMLCPPLAAVAMIPLIIYAQFVKFILAWVLAEPTYASRWRPFQWIICVLLFMIATPAVTTPMWCGYTIPPLYYEFQVRRFRKEMQWTADVPAIQAWLKSTDITQWQQKDIPLDELPACVRKLHGRPFATQYGSLVIGYGGGFCHWGMEIAAPGTLKPAWASSEYSLPIRDGAWVWIDDH